MPEKKPGRTRQNVYTVCFRWLGLELNNDVSPDCSESGFLYIGHIHASYTGGGKAIFLKKEKQ